MEKNISIASIRPGLNIERKRVYAKVRSLQAQKITVSTIAGDGTAGFLDGPALAAKIQSPMDVAVMPDDSIYIADAFSSCIRKLQNETVTTFAGNGNANITNGRGSTARFKIPSRITKDRTGNLYILDAADPRIRMITPSSDVSIYAGTNIFGFKDGNISVAQFGQSFGIVTDVQGNMYVADSQNDSVRKISHSGTVSTIAGKNMPGIIDNQISCVQFHFITGIGVDKKGNVFVSDLSRICKIDPTGVISIFAGNNIKGYSDGKYGIAKFSQIEGLVIDNDENIYVTDENRIRKITPQGVVSTIAGSVAGFKDGEGTSAKFNGPHGLAIDKQGSIYVADFNNKRVRKISFE